MIGAPLIVCEMLNLSRAPRTYVLRFGFVAILVGLAALAWPWNLPVSAFRDRGFAVFQIFFWIELVAATLLVPTLVAPAISIERERKTLDLLSVSPLTEFEIVFGKLVANAALIGSILLAGLPVAFAALYLGGVAPVQILFAAISILVTSVFTASVSILMSAANDRSGIATSLSLVIIMTIVFVTLFAGFILGAFISTPGGWPMLVLCPWSSYVADSLPGYDVGWPVRIGAWGFHLFLAACSLAAATATLHASRSPRGRRVAKKSPLPSPPKPLASAVLPMPPRPAMESLVTETGAAAIPLATMPEEIPMALMPTAVFVPPAMLPMPPQSDWWKYRKSMATHLPVGRNPIFWKEIAFRRNVGQQVLMILSAISCGMILLLVVGVWMISKASSSGSAGAAFNEVHFTLLYELAIVMILFAGTGSTMLGPEREQGTLSVLIGTGYSAPQILAGKLLATIYSMWPVLGLVAAHLIWFCFSSLGAGLIAALVVVVAALLAASVSLFASLVAGKPRRATSLTLMLLFAIWFGPMVVAKARTGWAEFLLAVNPFYLLHQCVSRAAGATGTFPNHIGLVAWLILTPLAAVGLFFLTAFAMEHRVRA